MTHAEALSNVNARQDRWTSLMFLTSDVGYDFSGKKTLSSRAYCSSVSRHYDKAEDSLRRTMSGKYAQYRKMGQDHIGHVMFTRKGLVHVRGTTKASVEAAMEQIRHAYTAGNIGVAQDTVNDIPTCGTVGSGVWVALTEGSDNSPDMVYGREKWVYFQN